MKKAISILAAGALAASLSVTAFAAEYTTAPQDANTNVYYQDNVQRYTVVIPAEVTLNKTEDVTDTVKIYGEEEGKNVFIASDEKVVVSVSDDTSFTVAHEDDTLAYDMKKGDAVVAAGGEIVSCLSNAKNEQELTFTSPKTDAIYSDQYTGNITFNIAIENLE